jgi:hypothetical protein
VTLPFKAVSSRSTSLRLKSIGERTPLSQSTAGLKRLVLARSEPSCRRRAEPRQQRRVPEAAAAKPSSGVFHNGALCRRRE